MDLATMRELPTESAATLQPSDEHSDTLLALASAVLLQLDTDATCPVFVKNIFQDVEDVLWYLREAQITFLPDLLELLVTGEPPSAQHFLGGSLPLKNGYGLYVLVLRKWIGDAFTGDWIYDYRLYLGSGTEKRRGIRTRFGDYDRDEGYSNGVAGAIHFGWQIAHRSIIAWAPLVEPVRHFQLQMLFLTLEATFSHVFAMHDHNYMKSLEKSFWNPATLDYQGLCSGSSLREIHELKGFFDLSEEELRAEVEALEKKGRERRDRYVISPEARVRRNEARKERRKDPRVAAKQNEAMRAYNKKQRNTPEGKAKKAAENKAYNQTPKGKAAQRKSRLKKKLAKEAKERAETE